MLLKDKITLITGASKGIGRAVALRFAKEGAKLILVARSKSALEKIDDELKAMGVNATLVPLDLTEGDKIDELGFEIHKRFGKLDILIGNAAQLGSLSPLGHITPKSWDNVLNVNLTANWRLIRSFDPLLRQANNPKVIFVTSGVGSEPRAYWGAYAVSKAALENLAKIYSLENDKVKVNLVSPGAVATRMRSQAFPGEDQNMLPTAESITDIFVALSLDSLKSSGEVFTPNMANKMLPVSEMI